MKTKNETVHGSADEVVGTIGQICKQTDTPAYKMAYRKAYDKAQAGGMNNSDSNDFAIEQAEFAIKQAENQPRARIKATPRPRFFWYYGGHHIALVEDGKRTLITVPDNSHGNRGVNNDEQDEIANALNAYNPAEHALLLAVAEAAEKVSMLLHDMTTEHFRTGYDKVEREALDKALAALRQG